MENQKNMIETALAAAQKPFYEFTPNGTPLVFTPEPEEVGCCQSPPILRRTPGRI